MKLFGLLPTASELEYIVRGGLLRPPRDLTFVGEFEVRGRQSTIRLWTLAASGSSGSVAARQELVGALDAASRRD
jgi:hypothetical protein